MTPAPVANPPFPLVFPPHMENHLRSQLHVGQDRWLFENVFGTRRNGTFVDVGAWGEEGSNSWFFEKALGWSGLAIEPNPLQFAALRKQRNCHCINAAIAREQGISTFFQIRGPNSMLSGLLDKYDPRWKEAIASQPEHLRKETCEIPVNCVSLQALLDRYHMRAIDYLSVDTEGAEDEILSTIDFDRVSVDAITIEDHYQDSPARSYLEDRGFTLVHSRWPDLFFVSRPMLAARPHLMAAEANG